MVIMIRLNGFNNGRDASSGVGGGKSAFEIMKEQSLDLKNIQKQMDIKETLRVAQILARELDYVPNEVEKAQEFLKEGMGEEIKKDLVVYVVGHYMGYSYDDINQEIFKEYFK